MTRNTFIALAAAIFAIVVFGNLLGNAIESFALVASWFGR